MISSLSGLVQALTEKSLCLMVGPIGIEVNINFGLFKLLENKDLTKEIKFYTYISIKNEKLNCYGFIDQLDLSLFKFLLVVSGVGPAGALNIMAHNQSHEIIQHIKTKNIAALASLKGISEKKATQIVNDLHKKIAELPLDSLESNLDLTRDLYQSSMPANKLNQDLKSALITLGYRNDQIDNLILTQLESEQDLKHNLTKFLKILSKDK